MSEKEDNNKSINSNTNSNSNSKLLDYEMRRFSLLKPITYSDKKNNQIKNPKSKTKTQPGNK